MNRFVIVESPFAGEVERNKQYCFEAMLDCLKRGEAPFASHILYTLVLDDDKPDERALGIEAGLLIGDRADATVVYTDFGISKGMEYGIERAKLKGRPIEYRSIR